MRKRLNDAEADHLGFTVRGKDNSGRNYRYTITPAQFEEILALRNGSPTTPAAKKEEKPFVLSAWNDKGYMMDIDEYCEHYKLPKNDIKSYKLVSHTGTPFYNILFKENIEEAAFDYEKIERVIASHAKPFEYSIQALPSSGTFDRFVYTDAHIGMDPNENGFSLYGGKWDRKEIERRLDIIVATIIKLKRSNTLYIDDLGDFVDGWDGETVRKGHHLPQNMDNEGMFDVGLWFKISMIEALAPHYALIVCNNITNDNHSGAFSYVINSAFKQLAEVKFRNVEVFNHRKFIVHYYVGSWAFVLSHGKDSKALKFGFKPHIDPRQIEKIDQYLKINDVYKHSSFIEFSKGDSHQLLFDMASSDDFDYCNYGALSPSSEWVVTNFKKGRSSAVFATFSLSENERNMNIIYF